MPKSRGRRSPGNGSSRRPEPPCVSERRSLRRRLGWPLCAIGGVLFLLGNIGARTGIVFLPFDPHHVIAQFGGALLLIIGLLWATGSQDRRRKR
jgi:heme A synthase